MQYYEDKLSTLDQAKSFAGQSANMYLNPMTSLAYSPRSWSVRGVGVQLNKGIFNENNLANKAIRGILNKFKVGTKLLSTSYNGPMEHTFDPAKGSIFDYARVDSRSPIQKTVNKVSGGWLKFSDDGYLGLDKSKNIKDTGFQKRMAGKINRYKRDLVNIKKFNGITGIQDAGGGRDFVKLQVHNKYSLPADTVRPGARGSLSAKLAKENFKIKHAIFDKLDAMDDYVFDTGKAKGTAAWFGKSANVGNARLGIFTAKAASIGHAAAIKTGIGLARTGIFAMKMSSYAAIAQLMWSAAKMVGNPIGMAATNAVDNAYNTVSNLGNRNMGGQLNMDYLTAGAATERQRAIEAISKSRINGRSMMGQEAQYMHA